MKTKLKVATGNYMNIFDDHEHYDIFVIFNEANPKPTKAEIVALEYIIKEEMNNMAKLIYASKSILSLSVVRNRIASTIEESEFDCVEFGVQVLINRWDWVCFE